MTDTQETAGPVIVATISAGNGGYLTGTPLFKPQQHRWLREPLEPMHPGAPWGGVSLYAWSDGIVTWKAERA